MLPPPIIPQPMNLKKILPAILLILAASCGSSADKTSAPPTDTEAYTAGRQAAELMLRQCSTREEICDRLLSLRAERYAFESKGGSDVAASFDRGLKEYLRQSGDTLFQTLFD